MIVCQDAPSEGAARARLQEEQRRRRAVPSFHELEAIRGLPAGVGEYVTHLQHLAEHQNFGLPYPAGLLLYGPPVTGKTVIAHAIARRLGFRFIHVGGSDFVSSFVGGSAGNVRNLFERACSTGESTIVLIFSFILIGANELRPESDNFVADIDINMISEDTLCKESRLEERFIKSFQHFPSKTDRVSTILYKS